MNKIVIKEMKPEHIDAVMIIDRESFTTSWTKEIFMKEIAENKFAHYFIVQLADEIIGYAGMWIVNDDAQVTNIAISPEHRGKKIGEKLFYFVFQHAIRTGVKQLSLEVRASNIIAQNMYQKFGLVPGGIRKKYYTDDQEDAIVMWVDLK